jgi:hypothetical protein
MFVEQCSVQHSGLPMRHGGKGKYFVRGSAPFFDQRPKLFGPNIAKGKVHFAG